MAYNESCILKVERKSDSSWVGFMFLHTSHNKCSHNVIAARHRRFDEGCEASAVLHFSVYSRKVVQEIHDCANVTCSGRDVQPHSW